MLSLNWSLMNNDMENLFKSIIKVEYTPFFDDLLTNSEESTAIVHKAKKIRLLKMTDDYFNDHLNAKNSDQARLNRKEMNFSAPRKIPGLSKEQCFNSERTWKSFNPSNTLNPCNAPNAPNASNNSE
jgi:hypothetical protein